jgi:hypothetical protein
MSKARVIRFSVVAILAVACGSDGPLAPPQGFHHAAATFACGPADGPAVAIYLTPDPVTSLEPTGPFVRVYVPRSLDQVLGKTWTVNGVNSEAGASFHSSGPNTEVAIGGGVSIDSIDADSTITGSVTLLFRHAGYVSGGFHAVWLPPATVCI